MEVVLPAHAGLSLPAWFAGPSADLAHSFRLLSEALSDLRESEAGSLVRRMRTISGASGRPYKAAIAARRSELSCGGKDRLIRWPSMPVGRRVVGIQAHEIHSFISGLDFSYSSNSPGFPAL